MFVVISREMYKHQQAVRLFHGPGLCLHELVRLHGPCCNSCRSAFCILVVLDSVHMTPNAVKGAGACC